MSEIGLKRSWGFSKVDGTELVKKKVREDPVSSRFSVAESRVSGWLCRPAWLP